MLNLSQNPQNSSWPCAESIYRSVSLKDTISLFVRPQFHFTYPYLILLTQPVVIFAGAMLVFTISRLPFLNISGSAPSSFANGASPGEWYYYRKGIYRIGITLHLGACLPAGFLMIWQFVPVIRHKALVFHRINGYLIIILVLISNVGAGLIARRAFGGGLDAQGIVGTLIIFTTVSIAMAHYNIKRLQIEQHRAWMLRAMFYLGSIITTRLIMVISAVVISHMGNYYQIKTCGEIAFGIYSWEEASRRYPECVSRVEDMNIIVRADFKGELEQLGASFGLTFGMAFWLAFLIHLVGVEIYLGLTPRESERLRRISYKKQLEAGLENPGSAGLTSDRWGDADRWEPSASEYSELVRGDMVRSN